MGNNNNDDNDDYGATGWNKKPNFFILLICNTLNIDTPCINN